MPRLSVLMPVYNAESFLFEAIKSILDQSYQDFEFLIVNDGSTDRSDRIIKIFNDSRIRTIHLPSNSGIVNALNIGLELSVGEFIARMDADDIACPNRLQKQVAFMSQHPEIGVSGTWVEYFGMRSGIMKAPEAHKQILWTLLFGSPFFHPSVIMRSAIVKNVKYPSDFPHAEDYGLWMKLCEETKFANLPEPLLKYRWSEASVGSRHSAVQTSSSFKIRKKMFDRLAGKAFSSDLWNSLDLGSSTPVNLNEFVSAFEIINKKHHFFTKEEFKKTMVNSVRYLISRKGFRKKDLGLFVQFALNNPSLFRNYLRFVFKAGKSL